MTARFLLTPKPGDSAQVVLADVELVRRCADGDGRALAALYRRHHGAVYRLVSRLVAPRLAEVDDIVQATFLTAWRRATDFEPRGAVRSWLFAIAVNEARGWKRARARFLRAVTTFSLEPLASVPMPEQSLTERQLVNRVSCAIARLPEVLRVAYVLCEIEELPAREAAEIVGATAGTMWRRLHEARKRLRTELQEVLK